MKDIVHINERENHTLILLDDGKVNALSFDMFANINEALDQAEKRGKIVIVTGRPGIFSAGFDLNTMKNGGDDMIRLLRTGAELSQRLLSFEVPVVLAVSGHTFAMGALLLLSADYRIGIEGPYKIGLNEVAIGLSMPYFGVALAREKIANNYQDAAVGLAQLYNPSSAVNAGFLDEVVEEGDLIDRATQFVGELSALNFEAHRNSKLRVREELLLSLKESILCVDQYPDGG